MERLLGRLCFYLGGAKSGKTRAALEAAESWPGPWVYLATAQARDEEMRARILAHQRERGESWRTVEAPRELAAALLGLPGQSPVLLDCLTLWVSNLLEEMAEPCNLELVALETERLLRATAERPGPVVMVSGEVGLGLVPMEPLSRFYRDALGRVNQMVAAQAAEAWLVVAGLRLSLKR
ncbi:MAG: bifunctional adenosylcobinamide kinase/adenosylcobinamide-phosphate guanylyltransferase [Deltaproteobacteria bacterium]|jgi:adenosylcobinamide kinase/adenosylcobinamide-phosphate guanylyltransferase|nr:bifunctional adenosylcobinamide kinase/adenosylcobinamide-phosphate guanylyltransferase [Deltaproteobacteria bacterium]